MAAEFQVALLTLLVAVLAALIANQHQNEFRHTLWWFAPFWSGGGYSSEAISFVVALNDVVDVRISQHGDAMDYAFIDGLPTNTKEVLTQMFYKQRSHARSVIICHSEPGAWAPPLYQTSLCPPAPDSLYVIGRTMFETDRLTVGHVARCNNMDEVWVPTAFHVETFASSGVNRDKLVVVPEPVDVGFFDPSQIAPLQLNEHSPKNTHLFRFLSVFKWEERKGWDILLKAYFNEFSSEDNVILYLKTNPYHTSESIKTRIETFIDDIEEESARNTSRARLVVLDSPMSTLDLAGLYKSADAFVLPSRGEGWGRPHVEAMSMALPIIATNWSGPTEFMTEQNSYPLPIDGFSTIEKGPFRQHQWALPSVAHLRRLMRHVVNHPDEARAKGLQAREDMIMYYSPDVIAHGVVQQLARIQRKLNTGFKSSHRM